MQAAAKASSTRWKRPRRPQADTRVRSLSFSSTADSRLRTSSSAGSASSTFSLSIAVLAMKWIAASIAPDWTSTVTARVMVDMDPQSPFSLARRRKAPAMTHGAMRKNTGSEPYSMERSGRRRMPVRTETGQSGPPQSTETLRIFIPGCSRMLRMARISSELTPTMWRIETLREAKCSPMIFCWITIATIFSEKQIAIVKITAAQKSPSGSVALLTRMMPPLT
mmetsp:Transcript_7760/g.22038  ORF Transcript_7760/g.22038 Transcript_7760/m.22038 type:complete len:223 (+) Transcript_7760:716-1384(+)